jgi:hypothetical protein
MRIFTISIVVSLMTAACGGKEREDGEWSDVARR